MARAIIPATLECTRQNLRFPSHVRLGPGARVDVSARLGVSSPRLPGRPRLALGSAAVIRSGTVLYAGSIIGKGLETGHNAVIREENTIGRDFSIWNNSTVDYGCRIGDGVKIHCNCYVAQYSVLEDGVFLAPGVTLANDLYPGDNLSVRLMRGPLLGKGVQVGVNATILPYIRIGAGSLVGAGAVVTKDVPPGSIVAGNPARILNRIALAKKGWPAKLLQRSR